MTESTAKLDADAIARYLTENPEFFVGRDELISALKVPHASGKAVSLVEKQLSVLRERNSQLRNRLGQLIENARDNDRLFVQSRKLVLALLDCKNISQVVDVVYASFAKDFGIESTQIIFFENNTISRARNDSLITADRELGRYLKARQTVGGGLSEDEIRYVFGDKSEGVKSAAISVLAYGEVYGVLAIGNQDPTYYQSNMGTLFLNHIAEVLSRVLRDLVSTHKP